MRSGSDAVRRLARALCLVWALGVPAAWADDTVVLSRGDTAEVWRRDARGEVTLERVFHADRAVVHYTAGELRALGVQVDWVRLQAVGKQGAPVNMQGPPWRDVAVYRQLDAADFGDMPKDPVVRKASRLDVRAGWRVEHGHEHTGPVE